MAVLVEGTDGTSLRAHTSVDTSIVLKSIASCTKSTSVGGGRVTLCAVSSIAGVAYSVEGNCRIGSLAGQTRGGSGAASSTRIGTQRAL